MNQILNGHMGYIHQQEILENSSEASTGKSLRDYASDIRNLFNQGSQKNKNDGKYVVETQCACLQQCVAHD